MARIKLNWFVTATVSALASEAEEAELQRQIAVVTVLPERQCTELTINVEAFSVRQAVSDGLDRIMVVMERMNLASAIVGVEALTEAAHLVKRMNPSEFRIVGVAEAQLILKVNSRQQLSQIAERPEFPRPFVIL